MRSVEESKRKSNVSFLSESVSALCKKLKDDHVKEIEERSLKAAQDEEKERKRIEKEKAELEVKRAKEQKNFESNLRERLENSNSPIKGPDGNHYALCAFCGKISIEQEFSFQSIPGHYCVGACRNCAEFHLIGLDTNQKTLEVRRAFKPIIRKCPRCGGELVQRTAKMWEISFEDARISRIVIIH